MPGFAVNDAKCANNMTIRSTQWRTGVEANEGVACDERVVFCALIPGQVVDHQNSALLQGVRADGLLDRRFARAEPCGRLEPLAVGSHKADQGDRSMAKLARQRDDIFEAGLGPSIEDVVAVEDFQAPRVEYCRWNG